jgi:hypothetical protein
MFLKNGFVTLSRSGEGINGLRGKKTGDTGVAIKKNGTTGVQKNRDQKKTIFFP